MNASIAQAGSGDLAPRGDVAIIGMACIFPGAPDLDTYWQNIVSKVDAVTDPPPDAWDPRVFYDPGSTANDRVYCKRGGYLGDLAEFSPLDHGVMPVTVDGGEPDQWLALRVAHEALADAGYLDRPKGRGRTEVILGKGTYVNRGNMTVGYHGLIIQQTLELLKTLRPEYAEADLETIKKDLKASLPPFGTETAPALIGNIIAGRIANRLDLTGPAYTVDAACASALIATEIGVRDLLSHKCDLALVGGVHVNTPVPVFMLFCQLGALSRREQIRPFDKEADGTILGEGLGMVVLKRLEGAKRDGDRIYAVIKGVGTSSDGRAVHVMAPRLEGEELALRLAYEMAGISPRTVGLIEAHGTATPVGDVVEIQALRRVFGGRNGCPPRCALGSVKSMIGHTMPAAGIAGLIKTALALYHKVLPPTLNCQEPNPKLELESTPFYVGTETRPWIHGSSDTPRRAGVNAFGFGGINAHVVLEEYPIDADHKSSDLLRWETEVCILEGASRNDLVHAAQRLQRYLEGVPHVDLKDLAYTLNTPLVDQPYRLAIVASAPEDLQRKLSHAVRRLSDGQCGQIKDITGIYFFERPLRREGRLAFLFPGEGAQYANMFLDLCLHFPEVRATFDLADRAFIGHPRNYLPSDSIFPSPAMSEAERSAIGKRLWQIDGAVEAVLIANWAMSRLLRRLEIRPDVVLGHSTGDYSAMFASGIIEVDDEASYIQTILTWNSIHTRLSERVDVPDAALVAVAADSVTVATIVDQVREDVYVAMDNCPHQTVIVGTKTAVERVIEEFRGRGLIYEALPFDRPYHTPMFKPYAEGWGREFFTQLPIASPKIETYSCTTMAPYPSDPVEIGKLFVEHWARPVRFRETIEAMYGDGVRIFVEVGPRGNLTGFVGDILRSLPHLAVPSNVPHRSGITGLNHLVGLLAAQGIPMRLDYLYARRAARRLSFDGPADVAPDRRKSAPLKLALGVPVMRVTRRRQTPVTVEPSCSPSPGQASQRSCESQTFARRDGSGVPAPPTASGRVARSLSSVMQEYVTNMDRFLEVQQQVMQVFLAGSGRRTDQAVLEPPPAATIRQGRDEKPAGSASPGLVDGVSPVPVAQSAMSASPNEKPAFPFLGTVTSLVPGRELEALRRLDKEDDLFLMDHTLGGQMSLTDEAMRPLAVVPLTMSMEILAEAAAVLIPDRLLIGMREVQAHRWICVGEDPVTLRITARRTSPMGDEVEVQIRNLRHQTGFDSVEATPAIQGFVIFGEKYLEPPSVGDLSLSGERVSWLASARLYDGELMFHGPCFQGVASVDRSGDDGLVGQLRVLPSSGLFRSIPNPRLVTDPVVLDAAGQLVGYWAKEYLERGFVVFPYRVEALHVYGPRRPAGERVTCQLRLQLAGTKQIRSELHLIGADGRVWMRLVGWEDMRFDLPDGFHRFWVAPRKTPMSQSWRTPISAFRAPESFECYRLGRVFDLGNTIWKDLWASLILTRRERETYRGLKGPETRRHEWLMGRTVAKDAARICFKKRHRLELFPADIEIGREEHGCPVLQGPWTQEVAAVPAVSLAHTEGIAVAVAGYVADGQRLGVDIEVVRQLTPGFVTVAFTRDEQELLASLPAASRDEWVMRFWCAKEAVAKALGRGMVEGPESVALQALDARTGLVRVALQGKLAEAFPDLAECQLVAYTAREEHYVVASTLCEKGSS